LLACAVTLVLGVGALPEDAHAAPVLRGVSSALTDAPAATLSIETPVPVVPGNVLIAAIGVRLPPHQTLVPPPGWTLVRRDTNPPGIGASLAQALYVHVVDGAEAPLHTWSWNSSLLTGAAGVILAYEGIDPDAPIEGATGAYTGDAASWSAPSVTTSTDSAMIVGVFASNGGRGITAPAGMNQRLQQTVAGLSPSLGLTVADELQTSAGASGAREARDASGRVNSSNIGQLLALRPAESAETPSPPILATALPPALPASTGAVYYVHPTGSDSNPGTIEAPWRTIQKALDSLRPGERVLVREGTYSEDLRMTGSGTASAPITISNYPGERPHLQPAGGKTNSYPIELAGAAFVRVHGFVIEGAIGPSSTNVYFSGEAHDIELSACEVRGSADQGIFSERSTRNIQILANSIHDNGDGSAPHQSHGIYLEGSGHLVANNVIYDQHHGFGLHIYPSADRVIVTANTIVENERGGIVLGATSATTVTNTVLVNNIVAFNHRLGISSYFPAGTMMGSGNVAFNNLGYGNPGGDFSIWQGGGIDYSGGNLVADPRFVDLGGRNLLLREESPAIGAALPQFSPVTNADGESRSDTPNNGAY